MDAVMNDLDVIEHLKNEIDSITVDDVVGYEPRAYNHEGKVD